MPASFADGNKTTRAKSNELVASPLPPTPRMKGMESSIRLKALLFDSFITRTLPFGLYRHSIYGAPAFTRSESSARTSLGPGRLNRAYDGVIPTLME